MLLPWELLLRLHSFRLGSASSDWTGAEAVTLRKLPCLKSPSRIGSTDAKDAATHSPVESEPGASTRIIGASDESRAGGPRLKVCSYKYKKKLYTK